MRAPRQPRKPRRLTSHTTTHRDGGGEVPAKIRPSIEDHVPTAPAPPPVEDGWEDWPTESPDEVRYGEEPDEIEDVIIVDVPEADHEPSPPRAAVVRSNALEKLKKSGSGFGQRAVTLWSSTAEKVRERNTQDDDDTIVIGNSVSLDARRVERRREIRKIRLKRVGIGSAVIAVILLISWILFASPLLRYQYDPSQITGYSNPSFVNKAELEALVASYDGEALLALNESALENDITNTIAEVDSVDVTRDFPRSLSIAITEAVPVACLGSGESCTAVTEQGVQLDIPHDLMIELPRIGEIGDALEPAKAVDDALAVLGALSANTRDLVAEISVANGELVTINLNDGRTVYWGGLERGEFKAQVLDLLVTQPASYYDVSIPDAPVSR